MLSVIGFNTNMVKPEEAPKGHADLLEAKWKGKLVKAHPSYSGTIMTATQQLVRDIGWAYFEKLAQQNVMQVQSAADTPKKISLGERAIQADGNEYNLFLLKEQGQPVEPVYAIEGTPQIVGPNGIFKNAPNPNAARLFQNWSFTAECQQLIIDVAALRSLHPQAKEKPGRKPLKDIKALKEDAVAVEKQSDEIKKRYSQLFKVWRKRHAQYPVHPTHPPERRHRARRDHGVRRADPRAGSGPRGDHARADRGGEERRQDRLLYGDGPGLRATARQSI